MLRSGCAFVALVCFALHAVVVRWLIFVLFLSLLFYYVCKGCALPVPTTVRCIVTMTHVVCVAYLFVGGGVSCTPCGCVGVSHIFTCVSLAPPVGVWVFPWCIVAVHPGPLHYHTSTHYLVCDFFHAGIFFYSLCHSCWCVLLCTAACFVCFQLL